MSTPFQRRHWQLRRHWQCVVVLVALFGSAYPSLVETRHGSQHLALVQAGKAEPAGAVAQLLSSVEDSIRPLREQVASGHVVPQFGDRSQAVLAAAVQQAGSAGAEIQRAVDAMLQSLFLRQLALLRQQCVSKFGHTADAIAQADSHFVAQAKELLRPGSSWSYEQERYALRAALEGAHRRAAVLAEEKQLAAQSQQSTVEIISKLQSQMESLQTRVQHLRSGSPWFLSSSYRIPGTPVQLIGRYQQGRGSIEVNLSPDRDPVTAEAGFVSGVGPANLGINANLGM
eukprot:TRINITY_DN16363_c0_g1_i2.p1 TRINITY_DN16363_c0_g1~~TRINITY_DN16363_c0_g1_i2.p1  ORF type:complete len:286 (-),score=67.85 TRINITY_DN16363_c0_g1_i2:102-959(-)